MAMVLLDGTLIIPFISMKDFSTKSSVQSIFMLCNSRLALGFQPLNAQHFLFLHFIAAALSNKVSLCAPFFSLVFAKINTSCLA